jgi:hypothetical protein
VLQHLLVDADLGAVGLRAVDNDLVLALVAEQVQRRAHLIEQAGAPDRDHVVALAAVHHGVGNHVLDEHVVGRVAPLDAQAAGEQVVVDVQLRASGARFAELNAERVEAGEVELRVLAFLDHGVYGVDAHRLHGIDLAHAAVDVGGDVDLQVCELGREARHPVDALGRAHGGQVAAGPRAQLGLDRPRRRRAVDLAGRVLGQRDAIGRRSRGQLDSCGTGGGRSPRGA